ncbi:MAG: Pyrrolo-quinoline quinone [Pedosphaera sp.]|nr:Pyrrolo-quinoline quinone [Pedosphaera sp.]
MSNAKLIFVGIKGTAIALDRATGQIVWQTHLKGSGFVQLVLDGDQLYATAQGEVFCLNPATGDPRWNNPLKGYGLGLASIAVRDGVGSAEANLIAEEERRRAEQASAAHVPMAG